jgi:hypothetical protein
VGESCVATFVNMHCWMDIRALWLASGPCWPAADVAALQACNALDNQVANDSDAPHCQLPTLMHHQGYARWQVKHTARQAQVDAWQHTDARVVREKATQCSASCGWCKVRQVGVGSIGMGPHEGHQVCQGSDLHVPHVQRRALNRALHGAQVTARSILGVEALS